MTTRMHAFRRLFVTSLLTAFAVSLTACSSGETGPAAERTFLSGTTADPGIALTVSSSRNALLMLQTGAPTTRVEIPLGASSTVTPVDFAVRGMKASIPLGNAASVALVDLSTQRIERFFTFASGNATGSAWVDDSTIIACNQSKNYCGRIRTGRTTNVITDTLPVAAFPTDVEVVSGRVFVISSNLDANYEQIGNGIVTELNPTTNTVVRTFTVGPNPQYAVATADGKRLLVTNSGDYGLNNGGLSIINLAANTVDAPIAGFGDFPGPIAIDAQGRVFVSSFSYGTIVWDSNARTFLRGLSNPVCAKALSSSGTGVCRGSSGAMLAPNGKLVQAFFGSSTQPSQLFVYDGTTLALRDSIAMPLYTNGVRLQTFAR